MVRRKRLTAPAGGSAAVTRDAGGRTGQQAAGLWHTLTRPRNSDAKLKSDDVTFILRNLATLVDNGVSLPRALATLAKEDTLAKHRTTMNAIRRKVENGVPFSVALGDFPAWDRITVAQIRVGERAGTLCETLKQLAGKRDKSRELRQQIKRKLAYPCMLVVLGSGLITFLLLYVVPVFEETYKSAGVPLPFVTQALIAVGVVFKKYIGAVAATAVFGLLAFKQLRRNDKAAWKIDRGLLLAPLFGAWLRDIAVLQMMDVLNNLMTAGFTLAEALAQTADSVTNRAVRLGVRDLQRAVQRGERFSREIERHEDLFPPIVNQLVIVGEQTGQLTRATHDICDHLRREIERKTTLMVGALEPLLTISLAIAIAVVLLAIYLPMFDMVGTVS
jgi:type IV pilus assembly protein PilC